jgi:hypothetical protein
VAENQPEHFAHPQRLAHSPRDIRERLRLPTLPLALGVEARVAQRAGGLCSHREQQIRVVIAECIAPGAGHGEHRHEAQPDAQRHREQRRDRRAGADDERVGTDELRCRRMRLRDEHGLTRASHPRDHAFA